MSGAPAPSPPDQSDASAVPPGAPLRILLASDYYPPFIGGVQRQIQLLGRELRARGHQVEVATIWSPGSPESEDDGGVFVHRLKQLRSCVPRFTRPGKHHPPPLPDPVISNGLRRVIRRLQPDIVHSYGWISYSCAAAMRGSRAPLVVSARDYAYSCATRTMLFEGAPCSGPSPAKCIGCASDYYGGARGWVGPVGVRLSGVLLRRRLSGVHSISTYVRDVVRRDFLDERKSGIAEVVLPSFAEDASRGERDEDPFLAPYLDQLPDEPFLMFVGALRLEKGLRPLLAAYAGLDAPPPLVLIGTLEPDTPDFPPGVVVLRDFPHAAVMAAWRRCLFGVVPSLWPEPLGSVVYEGMLAGRAMIGTVPGGHSDMIEDGVSGLLVAAGDVAGLAGAMRRLIEDPESREAFGRVASDRASRFTAPWVVPRLERFYRDRIAIRAGVEPR